MKDLHNIVVYMRSKMDEHILKKKILLKLLSVF